MWCRCHVVVTKPKIGNILQSARDAGLEENKLRWWSVRSFVRSLMLLYYRWWRWWRSRAVFGRSSSSSSSRWKNSCPWGQVKLSEEFKSLSLYTVQHTTVAEQKHQQQRRKLLSMIVIVIPLSSSQCGFFGSYLRATAEEEHEELLIIFWFWTGVVLWYSYSSTAFLLLFSISSWGKRGRREHGVESLTLNKKKKKCCRWFWRDGFDSSRAIKRLRCIWMRGGKGCEEWKEVMGQIWGDTGEEVKDTKSVCEMMKKKKKKVERWCCFVFWKVERNVV